MIGQSAKGGAARSPKRSNALSLTSLKESRLRNTLGGYIRCELIRGLDETSPAAPVVEMPQLTEPTLRVTMLPRDTNGRGTIFGGVILSHIDLAGGITAARQAQRNFVTRAMREVEF